jgi:hypothetical protein
VSPAPAAEPAAEFLSRLSAVTDRLEGLAARPAPGGLTEADQPSGERWEWGQVWAHLAEFPDYWLQEIAAVLTATGARPVPFGRTKADPGRIAAIERDRGETSAQLMSAMRPQLTRLRSTIEGFTSEDWSRPFHHVTLGEMDLPRVMDRFLVGHLEEHADQLDGLLTSTGSG